MADVLFEDEDPLLASGASSLKKQKKVGMITQLVIKSGMAKTESGANVVMLTFVILLIAGAGIVFYFSTPHVVSTVAHPGQPNQDLVQQPQ